MKKIEAINKIIEQLENIKDICKQCDKEKYFSCEILFLENCHPAERIDHVIEGLKSNIAFFKENK